MSLRQYLKVMLTISRRLEDVLKTSWEIFLWCLWDVFCLYLIVFKTSWDAFFNQVVQAQAHHCQVWNGSLPYFTATESCSWPGNDLAMAHTNPRKWKMDLDESRRLTFCGKPFVHDKHKFGRMWSPMLVKWKLITYTIYICEFYSIIYICHKLTYIFSNTTVSIYHWKCRAIT